MAMLLVSFLCPLSLQADPGSLASDRMSYPGPLSGRYAPREDLPDWMRAPRWCTTDAPRWGKGQTAALIDGYADRHAGILRLGMFWGGLAHYPSAFAPRSPKLQDGVDPLAEAIGAIRRRGMHILTYLNPNAWYAQHPLYATACLYNESGQPWEVKAYGREGTRYACINSPDFLAFYRQAIEELVGRYDADGIYVDGLSPHVCYCQYCRAKFRRDTGHELPAGLTKLGALGVLWEMTSDWDVIGDPQDPELVLYSRWLMKCLTDATRAFAETARRVKPDAVVVFHSWPKPDILPYYSGTLNEIYARKPWRHTLWKRAEFANWGDVFEIPSLVNIYLRQSPWGGEARKITSEVEARHLYWQALANGAYPNAWAYLGCERPFQVAAEHADCYDFTTCFPARYIALPRPMFHDARHRKIASQVAVPLQPGNDARLRIVEREPGGRIDLLCLRTDDRRPSDEEYRAGGAVGVIYVAAKDYAPERSVTAQGSGRWTVVADPAALSGAYVTSSGHAAYAGKMPLEYDLPRIESPGLWRLWARVIFPDPGSDSFFWQVSNDAGRTWLPGEPRNDCALGWEQPQQYAWVEARVAIAAAVEGVDRFLSPGAGMFAGLLQAGLPVKQMHPNHLTPASIAGFRVLVLTNEVCLSDQQCDTIRSFVRAGGALLATHQTSLYNLAARRRSDLGLADLLGAKLRLVRPAPESEQALVVAPGDGWERLRAARLINREESLLVEPTTATVLARWEGTDDLAILLHEYGRGRVVYLPNRLASSYANWADDGFPALLRDAIEWLAGDTAPARIELLDQPVGVTCFEQPSRNRRLVHLVNYNAPWVEGFETIALVENVAVRVAAPEGALIRDVKAVLSGEALATGVGRESTVVTLPRLNEYELLEVTYEPR